MALFKSVAGAVFVLLPSYLMLKIYQKTIFLPQAQSVVFHKKMAPCINIGVHILTSLYNLNILSKQMSVLKLNNDRNNTIQDSLETMRSEAGVKKQRKRKIICKPRTSGITFKPKFKSKDSAPNIVYMVYIDSSSTVVFFSNVHHASETKARRVATQLFDIKLPDEGKIYIKSLHLHCKGLFVLPHATNTLVVNPKTKEAIVLPQGSPHFPRTKEEKHKQVNERVAFGFIQSTQAFKVAQFFYRSLDLKRRRYDLGFEVFTLGMSESWRVLAKDPPYPIWSSCSSFTGKRVYFYILDRLDPYPPNAFLCFNFKSEKFSLLYPPYSLKHTHVYRMRLSNLGSSLCLSLLTMNDTRFNVFTSKHGNNIDWTPRFCFNIVLHGRALVLPMAEYQGNLLYRVLDQKTNRLEYYNVKDGSCEEVNTELVNLNIENKGLFISKGKPWYYVSFYEESLFRLGSNHQC